MALEIKQSLRLSQQLVMTPQLQQAIKLLQLNRLELADVVNQELMENPLLEEAVETTDNPEGLETSERTASSDPTVDAPPGEQTTSEDFQERKEEPEKLLSGKEEIDWDSYIEELNTNASMPSTRMNTEELPSFENILTKTTTLNDHLRWQLGLSQLTDIEKKLGELVIGNLSDEGYLLVPVADLAAEVGMDPEDAGEVLKIMQLFDPVGVCAQNLQECLMAQALLLKPRNELVERIIASHLSDLEKKNYAHVGKALGVTYDEVIEATKVILELEPKPGRSFVTSDNTQYITPDIYVYRVANEFVISLNEDGMPKLRISSYYKNVLSNAKKEALKDGGVKASSGLTKDYIQDKLRSAVWLIRSIHNRQKTIYKVTESIVKHQREFFEKGVSALKPMILKDVATDIGMHESTVSRVTTNKFMHTPVGTFELKYFFNSSISAANGGADVASETVKEKIRQMVGKEDQAKPLSDQRIVELLVAENIDIARRTVAKYREMLGILSSSKRKKVF
ncbi:MAG: RNA polymerase factor sigma-54 [Deltaproteobacteria bacterium]|nr:RNA polymerase factor sigma-54 [Deltaproteobacteria bacterium]